MNQKQISLSFVNKGKAFFMPYITVGEQERILEEMVELEKEYEKDSDMYVRKINKKLLLDMLQTIDPSVTEENINNMHPDDFLKCIRLINTGGRELSEDEGNFQEKKKKKVT